MIGLTPRQQKLFAFIRENLAREGIAPSYAEMCEHMGVASKSNIHQFISHLVERGVLRQIPGRARALELLPEPSAGEPVKFLTPPRITIHLKADGTLARVTRYGTVDVRVRREGA